MDAAKVMGCIEKIGILLEEIIAELESERPYPRVYKYIGATPIKFRQNPGGIGGDTRYIQPGYFIETEKPVVGRDDFGNRCLIAYARLVLLSATPHKGNNAFTEDGEWIKTENWGYVEFYPDKWEEQIDGESPSPVTVPGLQ